MRNLRSKSKVLVWYFYSSKFVLCFDLKQESKLKRTLWDSKGFFSLFFWNFIRGFDRKSNKIQTGNIGIQSLITDILPIPRLLSNKAGRTGLWLRGAKMPIFDQVRSGNLERTFWYPWILPKNERTNLS